jgi:hypothetical protein
MPIRENGTSLAELITNHIPQALTDAAAKFVDSLKVSSISEGIRRGRRVVIKRRNAHSQFIFSDVEHTDPFLEQSERLASLGGELFPDAEWRQVPCFHLRSKHSLHRQVAW